jgi:hypothetical protein
VVFYELLIGKQPFHGDSREELLDQIMNREVRPPRQWDDTIPKELERICLKALSKRPSERYTTGCDMAHELQHFFRQMVRENGKADEKESLSKNPSRRKRRIILGGILTSLVGILPALLVLTIHGRLLSPESPSITTPPNEKSDLVDVFRVTWVGGGCWAILKDQAIAGQKGTKVTKEHANEEERRYALAHIIDPDANDVCSFIMGYGCAFTFALQPIPGIPWVRIDGIDIVVHNYEDLPEYHIRASGGGERMHVYYVEIDKPSLLGTNTFSASYFFQNDVKASKNARHMEKTIRQNLEFVRLAEGKPEEFFVRVNAKTPGVYTFSAVVRHSYKDLERKQTIFSSETFLFDKPNLRPPRRPGRPRAEAAPAGGCSDGEQRHPGRMAGKWPQSACGLATHQEPEEGAMMATTMLRLPGSNLKGNPLPPGTGLLCPASSVGHPTY